ncbi:winged helix-turn-helix transcriptional regulator [Aurantimonas aggregata]|uniref:Winged helix-turn-helix transcriptional regulator n=1 Tax=Aurantimonas aggregata TaxID=2047720 RepID=A0A6L9MD08_9HYPH|nr:Lrp/AsnC ligand binding domain-containing protein [Aurantimonas aggregata]NDV85685.1 winged helix-turn-helix transcriptional regulator [Aurantimonas aggregata]
MTELDQKDRSILRELQREGRLTNLELAERVHLSPTATTERVKRLTREGFILGYAARLAPEKLGRGMIVFVEVKMDRTSDAVFSEFKRVAEATPAIMECHMVAGGFDYLIKARVEDMAAYRAFLSETLLALPGVRETHTYAVMEEVKNTAAIAF